MLPRHPKTVSNIINESRQAKGEQLKHVITSPRKSHTIWIRAYPTPKSGLQRVMIDGLSDQQLIKLTKLLESGDI